MKEKVYLIYSNEALSAVEVGDLTVYFHRRLSCMQHLILFCFFGWSSTRFIKDTDAKDITE